MPDSLPCSICSPRISATPANSCSWSTKNSRPWNGASCRSCNSFRGQAATDAATGAKWPGPRGNPPRSRRFLDREGLARYARERADGAELLARGDELGELLERCQQANLRNGRIIRANQASTGSLLNILRGQDALSLYDSRGGTASSSRQRPLSQA